MSDKTVGGFMLLVASLVFSYYTVWVVVLVSDIATNLNGISLCDKVSDRVTAP